jgi:riboflavin synthase
MNYFALMFTGIIETTGTIREVTSYGTNQTFWIESSIVDQLRTDQSVSHSGVCLTIEETSGNRHRVTAIAETLERSNLSMWREGTVVNLERSLKLGDRLDGHIVQGHIDAIAKCNKVDEKNGSWEFQFEFHKKFAGLVIEKGSIAVNGISLTAFNVKKKCFTVAIIPYTFEHTNIKYIKPGDQVNLEFDMIGKYLLRNLTLEK